MSTRKQTLQQSLHEFLDELEGAHSATLLNAVSAGCAVIAYADGTVTPEERNRMISFTRRFDALRGFHMNDVINAFETATSWFEEDYARGEKRALADVNHLQENRRHAVMLLNACQAIAAADGVFHPQERLAMVRLCRSLNLDPAEFDLGHAPRTAHRTDR
ncbi:MAG: tellurite resistance TerB family protein [Rhodospirillales bacterium]|nr:tellurite resistance TerB family protein [Rhodospirillales bacterium]